MTNEILDKDPARRLERLRMLEKSREQHEARLDNLEKMLSEMIEAVRQIKDEIDFHSHDDLYTRHD